MFLQQLWQLKVKWDKPLPTEFQEQWQRLQQNLPNIQSIQIDRLVITKHKLKEIKLHGFSDASEEAYEACIYLRSVDVMGNITTKLLCSKSRVATLKTVPYTIRALRGHVISRHVPSFFKSLEDQF
jgi:hypothetical protein